MVATVVLATLASCNRDNPTLTLPSITSPQSQPPVEETTTTPLPNACPVEGCKVNFASIDKAGDELQLTFTANYTPEISGNHFHVYWSKFQAKQVSDNAESKFGVTQGDWEPTADNPYTTAGAVAVSQKGDSGQICVTAGDKDHNVLNPDLFECRDVAGLL